MSNGGAIFLLVVLVIVGSIAGLVFMDAYGQIQDNETTRLKAEAGLATAKGEAEEGITNAEGDKEQKILIAQGGRALDVAVATNAMIATTAASITNVISMMATLTSMLMMLVAVLVLTVVVIGGTIILSKMQMGNSGNQKQYHEIPYIPPKVERPQMPAQAFPQMPAQAFPQIEAFRVEGLPGNGPEMIYLRQGRLSETTLANSYSSTKK